MKKLLFFLSIGILFLTACEKEEKDKNTIANTVWTAQIDQTHTENGKTYPYKRDLVLTFENGTAGTFLFKEAKLPDGITLGSMEWKYTYTYNVSAKTGVLKISVQPQNPSIPFTVDGNKLKMSVVIPPSPEWSATFTKQ